MIKFKQTTIRDVTSRFDFLGEGGHEFNVGFDATDHFGFYCPTCLKVAIVIRIKALHACPDGIYFSLYCPACKKTGQRKIYVDDAKYNSDWALVTYNVLNVEEYRNRKEMEAKSR